MMNLVFAFAFVSLTVPGFVQAVRKLPWVHEQVIAEVKPWACDICMCFWSTAIFTVPMLCIFGPTAIFAFGPAYTVSMYLYYVFAQPTSMPPPPSFPE